MRIISSFKMLCMEIDNYLTLIQRWMKGREIFSWFNLHYIFTLSRGLGSQSKEILIDKSSIIRSSTPH